MNSASYKALSVWAAQPATHGEFGVYQMGEDQARSWISLGMSSRLHAALTVSGDSCWQRCEVQRQVGCASTRSLESTH